MRSYIQPRSATLDAGDLAYAFDEIADLAPGWSVELHEAFSGEASLLLIPEGADDEIGPTFVLRSDEGSFLLARLRWQRHDDIGEFTTLSDAMRAIRQELAALAPSPSAARH